jgi:cell division septum initiation protein DivIVA
MRDKKLSHMNRRDLIEIIYQLQQTEEKLNKEIEDLRAELADRRIRISESGSVAEAALSLNHVFEAAQAACDEYINEMKARAGELPAAGNTSAPQVIRAARQADPGQQPETRNDEQKN